MNSRGVKLIVLLSATLVSAAEEPNATDLYGDPIPAGAMVRLGTVRFRHGGWRQELAFSRDGRMLISTGEDSRVCFWDARRGKLIRHIDLGDLALRGFQLSPDGNQAAALGVKFDDEEKQYYRLLRVFDMRSGKTQSTISWIDTRGTETNELCYTPDGATLVTGSSDGTMRFWDRASGTELLRYKLPVRDINNIAVSPDGRLLIVVAGQSVYQWEWLAGNEPQKLNTGIKRPTCAEFSLDGARLVIGALNDEVCLWDVKARRVLRRMKTEELASYTPQARFFPDGKLVAASDYQARTVLVWDAQTGKQVKSFSLGAERPATLAVSPDGQWVAASGGNGAIHVWDVKTGEDRGAGRPGHEAGIGQLVFARIDGQQVAVTSSDDGTVRVWDAATGRQLRVMRHERWVRAMDVSRDGRYIATSSLDDTVRLWDAASGKEIYRLPGHGELGGHRAVAFSADSRRFASWGDDWYLRVWDVRTGKALSEAKIRPSGMGMEIKEVDDDDPAATKFTRGIAVHRAQLVGARQLLISSGQVLHVFDVPGGNEVRKMEFDEQQVSSLAVSPDGKLLLTSGLGKATQTKLKDGRTRYSSAKNQAILLRDFSSGRIVWTHDLPEGGAGAVAFSPDGKQMATSLRRPHNEIRIWHVESRKESAPVKDVPGILWQRSLAFSPDGKWLGCGQRDSTVLIWDFQSLAGKSTTD